MASLQTEFLQAFAMAYEHRFDSLPTWCGGQKYGNFACLPKDASLRRGGITRVDERFEIGDLRADIEGATLIVEYESSGVSTHNLLKYWPYMRGELDVRPSQRLLICHFSNWGSWGSYRDTWAWLLARMVADPQRIVDVTANQFDHGATDIRLRDAEIVRALDWIDAISVQSRDTQVGS